MGECYVCAGRGGAFHNALKKFMENAWSFVTFQELYYHDAGYFLVQFKCEDDVKQVIQQGPYTYTISLCSSGSGHQILKLERIICVFGYSSLIFHYNGELKVLANLPV